VNRVFTLAMRRHAQFKGGCLRQQSAVNSEMNAANYRNQAFSQACAFCSPKPKPMSAMGIWTKPLARRTLPRVRGPSFVARLR
jgi:hypothetical protein